VTQEYPISLVWAFLTTVGIALIAAVGLPIAVLFASWAVMGQLLLVLATDLALGLLIVRSVAGSRAEVDEF
jgi:hypothetical protein